MIVLDTDAISNLMRPRPSRMLLRRLAEVPADQQATTAITIGELAYGANRAGRGELYQRAMSLLAGVRILPFDRDAAECYGRIRVELESNGVRLADPDLRIAATTLTHKAELVTGNIRHFERVRDLTVHDWLHVSRTRASNLPRGGAA
jgi:predicted nucleic acid-binding protein